MNKGKICVVCASDLDDLLAKNGLINGHSLDFKLPALPFFTKKTCWEPSQVSTEVLDKVVDCFTLFQLSFLCDERAVKFPSANCWQCCIKFSCIQKPCGLPIFICKNSWQLQACVTTDLSKCGKSTPLTHLSPRKKLRFITYCKSSGDPNMVRFPNVFFGGCLNFGSGSFRHQFSSMFLPAWKLVIPPGFARADVGSRKRES